MQKKKISLLSVIFVVVVALASCGTGSGDATGSGAAPAPIPSGSSAADSGSVAAVPEHSKTFNVVTSSPLFAIDPHNLNGVADRTVIKMCYEPLIDGDHYGNYFGVLAESWEFNEACTEVTFHLKEGVQFSNGEPFNADVVLYNIDRLLEHAQDFSVPIQFFYDLVGGEKIDEYTVKMLFKNPSPLIESNLCDFLMIPMEQHKELGDQMFADVKNSGTGPWTWDEWISGQYAHYTKNISYRDIGKYDSYFEDGYIRFITEASSAAGSHISGDADVYISNGGVGADVIPLYAGTEDRINIMQKELTSYLCVRLGYQPGSPLYDKKVREALDLAIDRQLIADQITGTGRVPTEFFVEGVVGHDPAIPPYEFDPEKAKRLLAESTYNDEVINLVGYPSIPNPEDYALAIASMLEEVGFNVEPKVLDMVTFSEERDRGEWTLVPDAKLWTDGNPGPTFMNLKQDGMHADWEGPEAEAFYALGDRYLTETDPKAREEIAVEANNIFRYSGQIIPVAYTEALWAQSKGITGVEMMPDTYFFITYIDWDPAAV